MFGRKRGWGGGGRLRGKLINIVETLCLISVIRSDLYMFTILQRIDVTQQNNSVFFFPVQVHVEFEGH